jgi:hypothetical protein
MQIHVWDFMHSDKPVAVKVSPVHYRVTQQDVD